MSLTCQDDRCFAIFTRPCDCLETRKLRKFVGPVEVIKPPVGCSKNPNIVWLRTPNTLPIHLPVNVKYVHRCIACPDRLDGMSAFDAPLPLTIDGYDLWKIQALLAMRTDKKTERKQALTLWLGFGVESTTWEPVANYQRRC